MDDVYLLVGFIFSIIGIIISMIFCLIPPIIVIICGLIKKNYPLGIGGGAGLAFISFIFAIIFGLWSLIIIVPIAIALIVLIFVLPQSKGKKPAKPQAQNNFVPRQTTAPTYTPAPQPVVAEPAVAEPETPVQEEQNND